MRYLSLNEFLKEHFGQRVQKISLDAGFGCPNRGPDMQGGCIYCNSFGSGPGFSRDSIPIGRQIEIGMEWARRRYKAKRFIAYFQAYSSTYADISRLREVFSPVLAFPEIVGVAIGTRPDCIDMEKLSLIRDMFGDRMIWMEYGLQSASDRTLQTIERGHKVKDFIHAVELTRRFPFLICAHVIFGLPGEGEHEMMNTVKLVGDLKIEGVKFHQLYVIKGTKLHDLYKRGEYRPLEQLEYAKLVANAINILPKNTVIQRLTGDPRREELVAPVWSLDKRGTIDLIEKAIER